MPADKLPYMPLYVSDLIGATAVQKMTNEEFGCYVKLLCHAWDGDNPPYLENDDDMLRRLCGCDTTVWLTVRSTVRLRFRLTENGKWLVNERQLEVWEKQSALHAQRVSASKRGVESRRRNRAVNRPVNRTVQPNGITNPKPNTVSSIPSNESQSRDADAAPGKQLGARNKPTREEARAYCAERRKGIDAEAWYDHYESNGWKVGKNAMRDWKAAVRKWERSDFRRPGGGKGSESLFHEDDNYDQRVDAQTQGKGWEA